MFGLDTGFTVLLLAFLLAACIFEFINGFHDTANAVAAVIYTNSLKPVQAVVWSGIWNFIGVYLGGIAVAMGIVNLLPLETLAEQSIYTNLAMILALILTAIIWNLGTWWLGLPCSSSHTLIGSIFGVGIAFMFITADGSVALNWKKVVDAGLSLFISPLVGFGFALLVMFGFKRIIKKKSFFRAPRNKKKPPFWIRSFMILSSTGISFSHGSNDGQKGIGLIMIILITIAPAKFALDPSKNSTNMLGNIKHIEIYVAKADSTILGKESLKNYHQLVSSVKNVKVVLENSIGPNEVPAEKRAGVRNEIVKISHISDKLLKCKDCDQCSCFKLTEAEAKHFKTNLKQLREFIEYSPWWVVLMISISLGLGTMIGWKRIVVTIGEKIGKSKMSYAQGASSLVVSTTTIGLSSAMGLPVSTTHVLSSAVAGTMASQGGKSNLQGGTIKNILLAWAITLPVTIILSCLLFLLFNAIMN